MPTTDIIGPTANAAIGTGLGDGVTYAAWSQPQRIHATAVGSSATVTTTENAGHLWTGGDFSGQFTATGTNVINGVELVGGTDFDGSGAGNIGNAGSTGASEAAVYKMYLYNGSAYAGVEFIATPSGGSLSGDALALTLTGGNKRYRSLSGTGVFGGADNDLHGLSWDVSNASTFGFAFTCTSFTDTPVVVATRGIGLRITYTNTPPTPVSTVKATYNNKINHIKMSTGNINISSGKLIL
tara:strand:+ start:470 stop:1189 length:720 start_codon:yes stop_codon:yes gene_type:complete